jgi:hypothetical protein
MPKGEKRKSTAAAEEVPAPEVDGDGDSKMDGTANDGSGSGGGGGGAIGPAPAKRANTGMAAAVPAAASASASAHATAEPPPPMSDTPMTGVADAGDVKTDANAAPRSHSSAAAASAAASSRAAAAPAAPVPVSSSSAIHSAAASASSSSASASAASAVSSYLIIGARSRYASAATTQVALLEQFLSDGVQAPGGLLNGDDLTSPRVMSELNRLFATDANGHAIVVCYSGHCNETGALTLQSNADETVTPTQLLKAWSGSAAFKTGGSLFLLLNCCHSECGPQPRARVRQSACGYSARLPPI